MDRGGDLKPSEYSPTVLGLIFLRYADVRFTAVETEMKPQAGARRKIGPADYHAAGVIYLPESARFVEEHRKNPTAEISVHGQERVADTSRLARLNLAVRGLSGEPPQPLSTGRHIQFSNCGIPDTRVVGFHEDDH